MSRRLAGWALVGAGRLGRALAHKLHSRRAPQLQAIVSKGGRSARRLRKGLRPDAVCYAGSRLEKIPSHTRLLLLAVTDRELKACAAKLAARQTRDFDGITVIHFAGALGPDVLSPLAERGAHVACVHPMQSFGIESSHRDPFRGVYCRLEASAADESEPLRLIKRLGLTRLPLSRELTPDERARYHLASALSANDLTALFSGSSQLLQELGVPEASARLALVQLVRGALTSIEADGLASGLSGPASRGDAETLRQHLEVLKERDPKLAKVHGLLSGRVAELAAALGLPLSGERLQQIRRLCAGVVSPSNPR